jgi:hypothetical protein
VSIEPDWKHHYSASVAVWTACASSTSGFCEQIDYEILVGTDEPDRRLELLHDNVRKYGTVFNTVAPRTDIRGVLVRPT